MARRTNYYLSIFFPEEFQKLLKRGVDFEYIRTSFTKKLKTNHSAIIFNNDGTGDDLILSLINKVRNDATKYLQQNEDKIIDNERIYFLDMFDLPIGDEIIVKVDLTSAYWKFAIMEGIVSRETNDFFNATFDERSSKEKKSIRLKALGSLATRKEIETFKNGKSVDWETIEQPTKRLYMHICRCVDNVMRECKHACDGCIFYYWDCMFVRKQFANDVIAFFKQKQFECKSEETRLSYDEIGTKAYFTSEVDGKMYMVEREHEKLINKIIPDENN